MAFPQVMITLESIYRKKPQFEPATIYFCYYVPGICGPSSGSTQVIPYKYDYKCRTVSRYRILHEEIAEIWNRCFCLRLPWVACAMF